MTQIGQQLSDQLGKMPPLPLTVMRAVEGLEASLVRDLMRSVRWGAVWDEYLRTYVIEMYDVYYAFYSQFPEEEALWILASANNAAVRVHNVLRSHYLVETDIELASIYRAKLIETAVAYAIRKHKPTIEKQVAGRKLSRSIAEQLSELKDESRLTAQALAEGINVNLRTVQRHLAGEITPRAVHVTSYEEFFGKRLKRPVQIETP